MTPETQRNIYAIMGFVITVLIFWYYIMPMVQNKKNKMTETMAVTEAESSPEQGVLEAPASQPSPEVNPIVGAIMDGPGYNKGVVESKYEEGSGQIPSNYYFLDDGAKGQMSIQHNLCSKSCCNEQWPTPFKLEHDPYVCQNKDKFVSSNITCSNSFQDSGCLCLTKNQAKFMYNRGTNGRNLF